jgi:hypothetical protein
MASSLIPCPGCRALLPDADGPTHRYIDASPACWAIYTTLNGGGEPPMAPAPSNVLIVDAYAAQHPGTPSPQSIQSVAVHLITMYGVLEKGVPFDRTLWLRQEALNERYGPKKDRFTWLTPPDFTGSITVADIARAPTPEARTAKAKAFVENVWRVWVKAHKGIVAEWYQRFIRIG